MQGFVAQQQNNTNSTSLANSFYSMCTGKFAITACTAIQASILTSTAGNYGKRAGRLCTDLGLCTADMTSGCQLNVSADNTTTPPTGTLDLCTLQGTSLGASLAGVAASTALPPGMCQNTTDCNSADLTCMVNLASAQQLCTCTNGTDTCIPLGTCRATDCASCGQCVAATKPFAQQQALVTNASAIAQAWTPFCATTGRSNNACAVVAPQIAASFAGNLGKRAAALCNQLQECAADMGANCSITSSTLGVNTPLKGPIDLCSAEGVTNGTVVMGIAPVVQIPIGHCVATADCGSPDLMCSMASTSQMCTCSNGLDTCTNLGSCVKTPCKTCKDCVTSLQPFVTHEYSNPDQVSVSNAFLNFCVGSSRDSALCAKVATAVNTSQYGNLGKRAAGLCAQLNECTAETNTPSCQVTVVTAVSQTSLTATPADMCTLEGVSGGSVLMGMSATGALPAGTCYDSADCGSTDLQCRTDSAVDLCTCTDGADTCKKIGACVPTPCKACRDCISAMQPFTSTVLSNQTADQVANAFYTFCLGTGRTSAGCFDVQFAISGTKNGNLGRRPGAICKELEEGCNQDLGSCTITGSTLDVCSQDGLATGSLVPNIAASTTLPSGTCRADADCNNLDKRCSMDSTTELCTCSGAVDTCTTLGQCVDTPCKTCKSCILKLQNHTTTEAHLLINSSQVATDFYGLCMDPATGLEQSSCQPMADYIGFTWNNNFGKRAGALCGMLNQCALDIASSCQLSNGASLTGALDTCTVEGIALGAQLPGVLTQAGKCLAPVNLVNLPTNRSCLSITCISRLYAVLL